MDMPGGAKGGQGWPIFFSCDIFSPTRPRVLGDGVSKVTRGGVALQNCTEKSARISVRCRDSAEAVIIRYEAAFSHPRAIKAMRFTPHAPTPPPLIHFVRPVSRPGPVSRCAASRGSCVALAQGVDRAGVCVFGVLSTAGVRCADACFIFPSALPVGSALDASPQVHAGPRPSIMYLFFSHALVVPD